MQEAIGRLDGVALLMGSGFCDFCQTWHSAGCCHPGRRVLAEKDRQIAALEERLAAWRDIVPMLKALIPSSHDVPAVGIYLPWQYIQKLKDLEEI